MVASTPMQQMARYTYRILRLGFLYQGTLSSAISRVRIGSDVPSIAPKRPMVNQCLRNRYADSNFVEISIGFEGALYPRSEAGE